MLSLDFEAQSGILSNIGLYSYGSALLAYIVLIILTFISRRNTPFGYTLLTACCLTALWAAVVTSSVFAVTSQGLPIQLTEAGRNAAWIFLLLSLISLKLRGTNHFLANSRWIPWYIVGVALILLTTLSAALIDYLTPAFFDTLLNVGFGIWLAMTILGLLLLEQLFRNSDDIDLWATKHFYVGLGIMFAYDLFMYAEALLFQTLDPDTWQARGFVNTMAAVLIATSVGRIRTDNSSGIRPGIHLSRHVAFHTLTLMASGIYLITMALAAYVISYLGGSWGTVLQIVFLVASGLVLTVLLFSGQIRARFRVWLSKNFFSYKYDYRTEWLEFTRILASGGNDIPENVTRAVAKLAKSPAGILWSRSEDGRFGIVSNWAMPSPKTDIDMTELSQWLEVNEWIIDLREWGKVPDLYRNLQLPHALIDIPRAWLLIPLVFGERVQGILLLRETDLTNDLNWEDRDLLKVAGRQAGSHLAQYQADKALVESRQFEAFNRLSAYVIHDLKNILAQLSLVVSNAEKHKDNPDFIDDMVNTVSNTVNRMNNLMSQLRSGESQLKRAEFSIQELLKQLISDFEHRQPVPKLLVEASDAPILECDRDRLQAVFEHLVQNAQEATGRSGQVTITLSSQEGAAVVEIEDNGVGMDEHFIRHRLFRPFDSTKGLTGMGIGAFESRDFVRSLGGEISVQSTPGIGSLFRVQIPHSKGTEKQTERPVVEAIIT
ncbi:MAG: PEP-CTERM system histidine kinase PrsK [Halioglobus sp.]|nr:PEP-CTERM system histidine kinase PrsK [Halioglobus sp.]